MPGLCQSARSERKREDTAESYKVIKGLIEGKGDSEFQKSRIGDGLLPGKRNKRSQKGAQSLRAVNQWRLDPRDVQISKPKSGPGSLCQATNSGSPLLRKGLKRHRCTPNLPSMMAWKTTRLCPKPSLGTCTGPGPLSWATTGTVHARSHILSPACSFLKAYWDSDPTFPSQRQ